MAEWFGLVQLTGGGGGDKIGENNTNNSIAIVHWKMSIKNENIRFYIPSFGPIKLFFVD